jgi:hypothetical protein
MAFSPLAVTPSRPSRISVMVSMSEDPASSKLPRSRGSEFVDEYFLRTWTL